MFRYTVPKRLPYTIPIANDVIILFRAIMSLFTNKTLLQPFRYFPASLYSAFIAVSLLSGIVIFVFFIVNCNLAVTIWCALLPQRASAVKVLRQFSPRDHPMVMLGWLSLPRNASSGYFSVAKLPWHVLALTISPP